MASSLIFKDVDPADVPTPSADKETLFWDETTSPPTPAWKDSSGVVRHLAATGSIDTLTALSADPASPTDGDVWVRATGTTPTRTLELRIRDGGVTHTIAGITV